jgi:hypothetical protein
VSAWTQLREGGAHYNIMRCASHEGMALLREMFPDGEADEMNFVLFSTSGIHGTYTTIEDIEREPEEWGNLLTFLVVQPRIVCTRYGLCAPETPEDFAFLKKLRASSHAAMRQIGQDSGSSK